MLRLCCYASIRPGAGSDCILSGEAKETPGTSRRLELSGWNSTVGERGPPIRSAVERERRPSIQSAAERERRPSIQSAAEREPRPSIQSALERERRPPIQAFAN